MSNIKDYPLRKIADFLRCAYEKEIYTRWLTLYPLMEAKFIKFVSFEEYKNKMLDTQENNTNSNLTDEQIIEEGLKIVETFEKKTTKGR